jgi:hypothetical protein
MHFVYLTASGEGEFTSDNFEDVAALELNPYFTKYVSEAFKPLGVYLNFWDQSLRAGQNKKFQVMMVNDDAAVIQGMLDLTISDKAGRILAQENRPYVVDPYGQATFELEVKIPEIQGAVTVRACATPRLSPHDATESIRFADVLSR